MRFLGWSPSQRIRHGKPRWFHLERAILKVPAKDGLFETKDRESRDIPLSSEFVDFLQDYLRGKARDEFVLKNRSVRRSRDGTYDFDRPVAEYMAEMGFPEFYPHSMRHSWITELVNSGNHTLQEVSAWSGDGLDTIERTYWKKRVVAGSIDVTLRGEKKEARTERQIDDIKEILEMLLAGKVDQAKVATESASPKVKSALKEWLGEISKNSDWVYAAD